MRVPGWLYRPIMWLSQPRRAMLITTALATASVTLIVGSRAGWLGALVIGVPAVVLVALAWRYTLRAMDREERGD